MTNLLPPHAKKQIVYEYWIRVVCSWVILWSVSLLIGSIVLWPTYVLLSGNNDAYAEATGQATERNNEYQDLSAVLVQSSKKAEQIVATIGEKSMSALIADVWTAAETTDVQEISITHGEGFVTNMNITGTALDRRTLVGFRDRLEALPYVTEVLLPIDNLAQNEDIDFSLRITVNETTS